MFLYPMGTRLLETYFRGVLGLTGRESLGLQGITRTEDGV